MKPDCICGNCPDCPECSRMEPSILPPVDADHPLRIGEDDGECDECGEDLADCLCASDGIEVCPDCGGDYGECDCD